MQMYNLVAFQVPNSSSFVESTQSSAVPAGTSRIDFQFTCQTLAQRCVAENRMDKDNDRSICIRQGPFGAQAGVVKATQDHHARHPPISPRTAAAIE